MKNILCWTTFVVSILAVANDAKSSPNLQNNIEWFGMNLGGGMAFFHSNPSQHTESYLIEVNRFVPKGDLLFVNLNWPLFYLTVIELHPMILVGYLGGGSRLGVRLPLTADYRHELRIGTFIGMDIFLFHINAGHPTLSIKPHVQYIYNTNFGSIGGGIDVPLNLHFQDTMTGGDGYTVGVPSLMYGVMGYLRFTLWRRSR